ncbi:TadE family protein [Anaeromyxobacter sp. K]|uniref:TadE/TadG family type IV pilus assembly protein n=1 Tax=Anaeromyxobacter sp. (strain K) TaxID=447217 RepID=UPI00015F8AF8|nr:TadE/TadG family type IV pilus assembly protein [Anaeromyxobacter sp. K]ACG74141.1 TadE family protein [Anaeromyxobacter sp. K]
MRSRRHTERGVAAVEFALVLPFLLAIVLGGLEWGFYFFREQVVVNAAREGARAGSVATVAPLAVAESAARAALVAGSVDPTTVGANVVASSRTTVDPVSGATVESVVVTVSFPFVPLTGFGIPVPDTVWARAEMRR